MAGHSASKTRVNALMSRPSTPSLLKLGKTCMPATSTGMTLEYDSNSSKSALSSVTGTKARPGGSFYFGSTKYRAAPSGSGTLKTLRIIETPA
jgi:hypothetical protein